MYCNKCAVKVNEHDLFCYNCGCSLKEKPIASERVKQVVERKNHKCFDVFAMLSLIIGIISIVALFENATGFNLLVENDFLQDYEFVLSINGIVFGILGIKSSYHRGKAITGLVLSSLTTFISITMLIAYFI